MPKVRQTLEKFCLSDSALWTNASRCSTKLRVCQGTIPSLATKVPHRASQLKRLVKGQYRQRSAKFQSTAMTANPAVVRLVECGGNRECRTSAFRRGPGSRDTGRIRLAGILARSRFEPRVLRLPGTLFDPSFTVSSAGRPIQNSRIARSKTRTPDPWAVLHSEHRSAGR
jgi:hypothetical protein